MGWLSSDKLITRLIAKGLGVSILDVERMKVKFDKFDTDCSGSIEFDDFDHLLRDVLQVPKDLHLSPDRVRFFWGDIGVIRMETRASILSNSSGGIANTFPFPPGEQILRPQFHPLERSIRKCAHR